MAGLGTISIDLEARIAKFESDMGRAARIAEKNMQKMQASVERELRKVNGSLTNAATAVKGFVGFLSIREIYRFGQQIVQMADDMNKLAQKTGITTQSLSALQYAARLSGVGAGALSSSLAKMAKTVEDASKQGTKGSAVFNAIGVSVTDAGGKVRKMDDILGDIATRFSGYQDGATKAALAQQIFGKSGAELIPFLNQGAEGLAQMRIEAEKLGLIIGGDTAQAAENFNDDLDRLVMQAEGFGISVMNVVVPALAAYTNAQANAAIETGNAKRAGEEFGVWLKNIAIGLAIAKNGVDILVAGFQSMTTFVSDNIGGVLEMLKSNLVLFKEGVFSASTADSERAQKAVDAYMETLKQVSAVARESGDSISRDFKGELQQAITEVGDAFEAFGNKGVLAAGATDAVGHKARVAAPHIADMAAVAKEAAEALADWRKQQEMHDKEMMKSEALLIKQRQAADKFKAGISGLLASYDDEIALLKLDTRARASLAIKLQAEEHIRRMLADAKDSEFDNPEYLKGMANEIRAHADLLDITQQQTDAAEPYLRAWEGAIESVAQSMGDFVASGFDDWEGFLDSMKNALKRWISDVITTLASAQLKKAFGGMLESFMGGQGGGTGQGIMGMFQRFFGGGGAATGATAASGAASGASGAAGTAGAGAMSAGYAIPIVGWIAAAIALNSSLYKQGWKPEGGTLNYGNGGSVSGGGLQANSSMILGGTAAFASLFADKLFRRLGLSNGVAALLSGTAIMTRLFGRKAPEIQRQGTNIEFGAGGASGNFFADIIEKGGLFRSDKKYTKTTALDAQTQALITEFFKSLKDQIKHEAGLLGVAVHDVVAGAFKTVRDKKGEITEQFSTVLGKRYDEDQEAFFKRMEAENRIATVGVASPEASALAEGYRLNAEVLLDAANAFLAIQRDITKGVGLLGAGGGLGDVVHLLEDLKQPGELLSATLARVTAATTLYEDAIALMGTTAEESREAFVRMATEIAEAAGGVDKATELWRSFFEGFYTPIELLGSQMQTAARKAADQLSALGLDPNISAGDFRQRFEDIFPTLSAEDKVRWLEAADAFHDAATAQAAYTAAIQAHAQAIQDYNDFIADFRSQALGLDDFQRALRANDRALRDNIQHANELARAAGLEGAREQDLAYIHAVNAQEFARLVAELEDASLSLAQTLYPPVTAMEDLASASAYAAEQLRQARDQMADFADSLLLGEDSPIRGRAKADEGLRQLMDAAASGDASRVQALAQQVLSIGRGVYTSGRDFNEFFQQVQDIIRSTQPMIDSATINASGSDTTTVQLTEQERFNLAKQLAQNISDIGGATGDSIAEIAERLGVNLDALAEDLMLDPADLEAYINAFRPPAEADAELVSTRIDAIATNATENADRQVRATEDVEIATTNGAERITTAVQVLERRFVELTEAVLQGNSSAAANIPNNVRFQRQF